MDVALPEQTRRVAVVGTGLIGAGWAATLLARGLDVAAWDPMPGAEARARRLVDDAWPQLQRLGLAAGADPARLTFHADLAEAVAGVPLVLENGPEDETTKQDLFAAIEAAAAPGTIIASSTTALLISRVAARCARPECCIAAHPFNPPHLVPLVELSGPGPAAAAALDWAEAFFRHVGKVPVRLKKEMRGHIANRLSAALWREAVNLVAEGVATVADVDAAVVHGPGLRWAVIGPHLTYHLGGAGGLADYLKHLGPSQTARWADLGDPRLDDDTCRKLVAGVADEAAGRDIAALRRARDEALIRLRQAVWPVGQQPGH